MKTLSLLAAVMALLCASAAGQDLNPESAEGSGYPAAAYELPVESDMELFNVPLEGSRDIFSRLSEYNFIAVRYARRGYGPLASARYVNGIELSDAVGGRVDWTAWSALRYVPASRAYTSGGTATPGTVGGWCGTEEFSVRPSESPAAGRVSVFASDRTARTGLRAMLAGASQREKWGYSLAFSRRWGRDAHIDGLFMDETVVAAALERRLGHEGSLTLFLLAAPSERSSRTAATREAFDLTDNNLYNPAWGWYGGEQRSARVRRNFVPTGLLTYRTRLDRANVLRVSVSCSAGEERYSGLAWFESQNPLPDYYRYLPSRIDNPVTAEEVAGMWRARNPQVTQIDWDELLRQNAMADGQAACLVSEAVTRPRDFQAVADIENRPQKRLAIHYGLRVRWSQTDNFARAADLLGARSFEDVDQYLIEDERYGGLIHNDIRTIGRQVRQGEAFDYRYRIDRRFAGGYATVHYGDRRLTLAAACRAGDVSLRRDGLYEKQTFPGEASYGRSRTYAFTEYTIKLSAGYAFTPRHILDATFFMANTAPAAADIFLSPRYCNLTGGNSRAATATGVEANYRLTLSLVRLKLTGFYTRTGRERHILHHYDDIASVYGNLVMDDVAMRYYGAEAGAEVLLSRRLSLYAAVSAIEAQYDADPRLTLHADADGKAVYTGQTAFMKGYRAGGTPQTVASGELRYSGTHGWFGTLTVSYMDRHYIAPDPTRRMDRAMAAVPDGDRLARMLGQERFDPACVLNLFVCKSFDVGRNKLMALASVSNALNNKDMIYSGYEQMRMHGTGSGAARTYVPFGSKYTYAYGRTWYTSLIYKF